MVVEGGCEMNDNTWERIKNTQYTVQTVKEQAALDIANEIIWKLTGIRDHPYGLKAERIAEELESIL